MATNNGPVITPPAATSAADAAAHNAEIAAKLAAQDIMGKSGAPEFNADADKALDALAAQVRPDPAAAEAAEEARKAAEAEAARKAAEADPEAAKKAEAAAAEAKKAAEEAEAQKAADAEALKKADEVFKGAQSLAPNASQKSADAFRDIKVRAVREISALQAKLEEATKQIEEIKKQSTQPSAEQLAKEKELEEHRQWRAKLDVEADPKYKEYDKSIESAREFIYAQLKKHPVVSDAVIAEIKKYGGPDKVDMSKLFDAIKDDTTKNLVQSKIASIAEAEYNKQQALAGVKANISQYIQQKTTEAEQATTQRQEAIRKNLSEIWSGLEWTKPIQAAANATPEEKKAAETHNAFVEQTKAQLEEGVKDDSPKMRATLLTGIAQLFNLQRVHGALKDAHAALEKEVTELREWKARVKKAGTSRLNESNAPVNGIVAPAKPANQFTTPAVDALDALAKQVTDERRAKLGQSA